MSEQRKNLDVKKKIWYDDKCINPAVQHNNLKCVYIKQQMYKMNKAKIDRRKR